MAPTACAVSTPVLAHPWSRYLGPHALGLLFPRPLPYPTSPGSTSLLDPRELPASKDTNIVVFCRSGKRAGIAQETLAKLVRASVAPVPSRLLLALRPRRLLLYFCAPLSPSLPLLPPTPVTVLCLVLMPGRLPHGWEVLDLGLWPLPCPRLPLQVVPSLPPKYKGPDQTESFGTFLGVAKAVPPAPPSTPLLSVRPLHLVVPWPLVMAQFLALA